MTQHIVIEIERVVLTCLYYISQTSLWKHVLLQTSFYGIKNQYKGILLDSPTAISLELDKLFGVCNA
jgi:hypothetical protein